MFKIAIIGGGLGGLFAALSIHHHHPKQDVQIDIYEQAAQYKEIGAGVGLGPNAARLVEKLGLGEEARRISGNRDGVWFTFRRYDNGDEVLMVPLPDKEKTPQFPVHRAEFLDLLIRAVQQRAAATLHTRKQLQKLEVGLPCTDTPVECDK